MILKKAEKIDILINNAGYLVNKPFKETTLEDFQMVYSTNVFFGCNAYQKYNRFYGIRF